MSATVPVGSDKHPKPTRDGPGEAGPRTVVVEALTPAASWCNIVSLKDAGLSVRVLSCFPREGGRMVELVELVGDWEGAVERVRATTPVEVIEAAGDRVLLRIETDACPLVRAIHATGVVPRLPFHVREGSEVWHVDGTREALHGFLQALVADGVHPKVVYSGSRAAAPGLTRRQRDVLRRAVREGYYDYPRRISLTALARKIGVAKSTLSESLVMIERTVMHAQTGIVERTRTVPVRTKKEVARRLR